MSRISGLIEVIALRMARAMGWLWSCIHPYRLHFFAMEWKTLFYSSYIKRGFKHWGDNSRIIPRPGLLVGLEYISIGRGCKIGKNAVITAWDSYRDQVFTPEILIGDGTDIGNECNITAIRSIRIGRNVLMGKRVLITDNFHGTTLRDEMDTPPASRILYSKGSVVIHDNVWLGENAMIMPGVTVGEGAIVAANSVVTKDVAPFSVVAGVPAQVIRSY